MLDKLHKIFMLLVYMYSIHINIIYKNVKSNNKRQVKTR